MSQLQKDGAQRVHLGAFVDREQRDESSTPAIGRFPLCSSARGCAPRSCSASTAAT